ncbi:hypothetical protein SFRURICE_010586 [Spodoptera frugiperda]|nr:hypothetical protein SFRURICE_010586 [Spodoptera frugiperda]
MKGSVVASRCHNIKFSHSLILKVRGGGDTIFFTLEASNFQTRLSKYINLQSFNYVGPTVSEINGCDIRTDRQTDVFCHLATEP